MLTDHRDPLGCGGFFYRRSTCRDPRRGDALCGFDKGLEREHDRRMTVLVILGRRQNPEPVERSIRLRSIQFQHRLELIARRLEKEAA